MRTSTDEVEWVSVRSLSGTFLHEMMYFLDLNPHGKPPSFDLLNILLMITIVIDQKVTADSGKQVAAYGMVAVWMLGGKAGQETVDRSKALTNADTYNVLAMMAHLGSAEFIG